MCNTWFSVSESCELHLNKSYDPYLEWFNFVQLSTPNVMYILDFIFLVITLKNGNGENN